MTRPNILFIMTDQQRWDAMGCSGGWVQTPNLDRIAGEGIRFSNCVTNSPVCIPARVSMATGRYPHNTGIWRNLKNHDMPPETPTWMQAIREVGYRTSVFGKTHLHRHHGDLRDRVHLLRAYGLDDVDEIAGPRASRHVLSHMTSEWESRGLWEAYRQDYAERFSTKPHLVRPSTLPLEWYADTYVGRQAKQYLARYDQPEPWFCWVSFGGPHEPWDAPQPYASMYDPKQMPKPVPGLEQRQDRPRGVLDERLDRAPKLDPGDVGELRANYAGSVTLIDHQIGEILDEVEDRQELDNTIITFTSDHGEMNGDYGLLYKFNFMDGAVRVPMLIRTPETCCSPVAGEVCDSPVEWFDLGPTLVELAGGTLDHEQFARSLVPALSDPAASHRTEAISEFDGEVMLMNRHWKMAVNREGRPYLLFDRQNDPDEMQNLVGAPKMKVIADELRIRMLERLIQTQVHISRHYPLLE
jgi:choline-sulfatase